MSESVGAADDGLISRMAEQRPGAFIELIKACVPLGQFCREHGFNVTYVDDDLILLKREIPLSALLQKADEEWLRKKSKQSERP